MTKTMDAQQKFTPAPDVVAREVGGETILLDLGTGIYFGLNEVGGKVWQLLDSGQDSLAGICDAIEQAFDAPRGEIERDVAALLNDLAQRGLVTQQEG